MRTPAVLFLAAACQLASAGERGMKTHELNEWHPLNAKYKIHSGSTAYSELPTKSDGAVTVYFENEAAKQLFEQIGPDVKPEFDDRTGDRERRNKGVLCTYTARLDNPANPHYRCWIGIELRTGEGTVRVPC